MSSTTTADPQQQWPADDITHILTDVEPAVFIDRDNTLIHNDGDLGDPDAVKLKRGVAEGLMALRMAGFRLIVITNQGGVARGAYSEADVDAVHQRIAGVVEEQAQQQPVIDRFYYCPYHPDGAVEEYRRDHPWRKPHPGMLLQAARDMNLDLASSWLIGDQGRDVQAGRAAGCRTILIGEDEQVVREQRPTAAVADFAAAVELILRQTTRERPVTNGASGETMATATTTKRGRKGKRSQSSSAEDADPAVETRAAPPATGGTPPEGHTPSRRPAREAGDTALEPLRRTMVELTEELRTQRQRQAEFTPLKMAAGLCQLLVLLLALLGLLQINEPSVMMGWLGYAVLMQLVTITLLLFESR